MFRQRRESILDKVFGPQSASTPQTYGKRQGRSPYGSRAQAALDFNNLMEASGQSARIQLPDFLTPPPQQEQGGEGGGDGGGSDSEGDGGGQSGNPPGVHQVDTTTGGHLSLNQMPYFATNSLVDPHMGGASAQALRPFTRAGRVSQDKLSQVMQQLGLNSMPQSVNFAGKKVGVVNPMSTARGGQDIMALLGLLGRR